jgi:D,D-heptose 1,7-bisphosphate phosphatase
VVSNQSGIARGYFTEDALQQAFAKLQELLAPSDVALDDFYYCPHHPQGAVERYAVECDCRKPRPALIVEAAYEHDVNLGQSWLVGDILNDVEAGRRAGCRTVMVDNGSETEWKDGPYRRPDFVAADFAEAARTILVAEAPTLQK